MECSDTISQASFSMPWLQLRGTIHVLIAGAIAALENNVGIKGHTLAETSTVAARAHVHSQGLSILLSLSMNQAFYIIIRKHRNPSFPAIYLFSWPDQVIRCDYEVHYIIDPS